VFHGTGKPGDGPYAKFDRYRPRTEPPSGMAGGKVDRVGGAVADRQTAVNALIGRDRHDRAAGAT
jgi:peptide/nickel transport system substrate-binding protein